MRFTSYLIGTVMAVFLMVNFSPASYAATPEATNLANQMKAKVQEIDAQAAKFKDFGVGRAPEVKHAEKELSNKIHEYLELDKKFEPFKNDPDFKEAQEKHWKKNSMLYEYYRELGPNYDFNQDIEKFNNERTQYNEMILKESYQELAKHEMQRMNIWNDLETAKKNSDQNKIDDLKKQLKNIDEKILGENRTSLQKLANERVYNPTRLIEINEIKNGLQQQLTPEYREIRTNELLKNGQGQINYAKKLKKPQMNKLFVQNAEHHKNMQTREMQAKQYKKAQASKENIRAAVALGTGLSTFIAGATALGVLLN